MVKNKKHLAVDNDTFFLVMHKCKDEFIKYNPSWKGRHISQNQIILAMAEHYIESEGR